MSKLKNGVLDDEGIGSPPTELEEIFARLKVSPEFEKRCENAARLAYSISRLRRERERRGFFPISVESYIGRLASYAEVTLESVLAWVEVPALHLEVETIPGIGRLLRVIGFSLNEAAALLRVSFGEQRGQRFLPARIAYRGGEIEATELERAQIALDEMEGGYSSTEREHLNSILNVLRDEYARA